MSLKGVQRGCTPFACLARSNRKLLGAILVELLAGVGRCSTRKFSFGMLVELLAGVPPGSILFEFWWSIFGLVFHRETIIRDPGGEFSGEGYTKKQAFLVLGGSGRLEGTTKNLKEEFLVEAPGQEAPLRIQKEVFLVERAGPRGSTND